MPLIADRRHCARRLIRLRNRIPTLADSAAGPSQHQIKPHGSGGTKGLDEREAASGGTMTNVPRINASTVAEHREQRRAQLLESAASLIVREDTFTMARVAAEVGLSRSAVYEYYSSAADLIADVLIDELSNWASSLEQVTSEVADPSEQVQAWVTAVLTYAADGRHALVRAAGATDLPPARRSEVQEMHRALIAPLFQSVAAMGDVDPGQLARYIWGVVEVSIARIESGDCDVADEIPTVLEFVEGGLRSAISTRN